MSIAHTVTGKNRLALARTPCDKQGVTQAWSLGVLRKAELALSPPGKRIRNGQPHHRQGEYNVNSKSKINVVPYPACTVMLKNRG